MSTMTTAPQEDWVKKAEGKGHVLNQLRDFRSQIPKDKLKQWEEPTGNGSYMTIARDWFTILAGTELYAYKPSVWTFVVGVSIITFGQRGLHNLAHDSIHRNLVKGSKWNDVVANMFLAPGFVTTARLQRAQHSAHHHYLGTKADPDHGLGNETSLKHYRVGKHDLQSIPSLFLYDVLDWVAFYNNAVGSLFEVPGQMIGWWLAASMVAGLFEPKSPYSVGPFQFGWNFFLLYHLTRCTVTYVFYIFRESIDHSGLQPTGILQFSRNTPCCNWLQYFLQPHEDCYHLLHHLLPRIPVTRLHEAHTWLTQNNEAYEQTNRYTTYFGGDHALFAQIPEVSRGIDEGNDERFTMSQNKYF